MRGQAQVDPVAELSLGPVQQARASSYFRSSYFACRISISACVVQATGSLGNRPRDVSILS